MISNFTPTTACCAGITAQSEKAPNAPINERPNEKEKNQPLCCLSLSTFPLSFHFITPSTQACVYYIYIKKKSIALHCTTCLLFFLVSTAIKLVSFVASEYCLYLNKKHTPITIMSTFKAEAKKIATASPSNDSRHEEEKVWYLGYGSNMSSKVLSGRRQVFPVESLPVVVKGYQLTFDMAGLPYWEPGFGTIQPVNTKSNSADHIIADGLDSTDASKRRLLDGIARNEYSAKEGERMPDCQAGSPLHCIAHLITRKEMDHIINTEGGNGHPDFGYQVVEVECQTYDGKPITGVTLIDKDTRLTRRHPSARYHKILLDGAAEHGLSPEYIERLAAIMPYTASTFGQKTGKWAMLVIGLPLALPVIISSMAALIFKVKVPLIMAAYGEWTKRVLWTLHDYVFAPIFGAGC